MAAARFPAAQKEYYDLAVKARDKVVARMTRAQIAEAEKPVQEWKAK